MSPSRASSKGAESAAGTPGPSAAQGRLLAISLAAGLIAGGAGWLAGEAILGAYADVLSPKVRREVDAEAVRRYGSALVTSAAASYAALGAILGIALGVAGGLARRSAPAGARAALAGGLAGLSAGASTAMVVLPGFLRDRDPQAQDLLSPLLTIGSIAAAIGAAGGLALGLGLGLAGLGRRLRPMAGGLLGAALGVAAYEVIGAVAFPSSKTDRAISTSPVTRAMLHILAATLAAAGSALGLRLGLSPGRPDGPSPASTSTSP